MKFGTVKVYMKKTSESLKMNGHGRISTGCRGSTWNRLDDGMSFL